MKRLLVLCTLFVLPACQCGARAAFEDEGDAGKVVVDSGQAPTAVVVVDAGDQAVPDSGPVVVADSGTVVADAGPGDLPDSGTVEPDAGSTPPDAGVSCDPSTIPSTGEVPLGCVRLENAIGQLGSFGLVTLTGWSTKTDEPSALDGFSFTSDVPVGFAVKCGTETFYGTSSPWANPNGDSGPTVSAISNITFCPCQ